MNYAERFTQKTLDDKNVMYFSDRDSLEIYVRLGLYEDTGLSPTELADALIQGELMKPPTEWDMSKIEKWQTIKTNYYKYITKKYRYNQSGYDNE